MAELRELIEELGGTDVATLLNSGNVVFQIDMSPKTVDGEIGRALSERFGFQVDVVCCTKQQLESVLAHDPFGKVASDDSKYVIAFMSTPPRAAAVKPVLAAEYPNGELCALKGREFYVWTPNGVSGSKSLEAFGKSKAVDCMTVRNVRTLKKIIAIL